MGPGASVSKSFDTEGQYVVTASATDMNNNTGSASIQITVGTPAPATYSVASVMYWTEGGKGGTAHLRIGVKIVDGQNNAVSGAVVTVFVTCNGSSYYPGPATTGTDGVAAFKLNNAPSGTYVTEVKSVQVGGVTYYPTTPENQFPK